MSSRPSAAAEFPSDHLDRRVQVVADFVGTLDQEDFVDAPAGWPDEISTALLDAVYSAQQRYHSNTPGAGVYNRVLAFRQEFSKRDSELLNDLSRLVTVEESEIRSIMGNNVVSDGKSTPKSVAVRHAAARLLKISVGRASDLHDAKPEDVKKAYTGVPGLGWITHEYFLMLLGQPGIKADVMITRFVNHALSTQGLGPVHAHEASWIIKTIHAETDAARGVGLGHFDHILWRWQRSR
ncbi:hypothetical protein [Nesterenkonia haasae]|uniref:hypothetical protein n=1 Tax=Nesterenkonia haasae TaxID=2587813 RepID=UPI001391E2F0|nr:hypothetical protein [Nesterenkonia haasae]NDK32441.1 hypothetical protein [Nesterenkonia haasae]